VFAGDANSGVSCESCHGPASLYLKPHQTKDSYETSVSDYGMTRLVGNLRGWTQQCTNCHIFDDSSKATYGPNLTHLASRTVFASGSYPLTKQNLTRWVRDAPSMIPMSSQGCRLPPGKGICVGMPSFINNTPPGLQSMTPQQADQIADFLLEQK